MSTTTLQIEKKKMVVPQLRFKGFDGEWELNKLGEVAQFKAGYAFKSEQMLAKKSNYQLLKMSNVYQNELRLDRNPSFWNTIDAKQKEFLLKKGDSILTLTGTVGKKDYGYSIKIEDDDKYLLNQRLVLLREIQNKSDNGFINYLISTEKFLFYFFGEAKGGTGNQTNVSTEDIKNIQLNIPPLSEQQKIASFLSAVDEKIQQLSRKAALLEQYKKGVMQQLFSGKLRFKDENGKDYPDWEEKKLGDICDVRDGTHDSPKYVDKGFPFITSKNLMKNGSIDFENVSFINELDYNKINQRSKVNINDILFGMIGTIGNPVLVKSEGFAIKNVALIKEKKDLLNLFLIHFLKGDSINQQFFEQNTGGTQKFLSLSVIRNLIAIVPSLPEQQKIANFLSGIDGKIEQVHRELAKTQEFKKGLLQQLFV